MSSYHTERHHTHDLFRQLDRYLPEKLRATIERDYYARVGELAQLDQVAHNAEFLSDPMSHVAIYSDHSVVHVRDVATNILQVLDTINGVLIPRRNPRRLDFMKGCGVVLAYNHDIGMRDFSAFGRTMHPEFAAQEVFSPAYDDIIHGIWEENSGNLAWQIVRLTNSGALDQPFERVLREILAMSVGHSKSKVPIRVLNDPHCLRHTMISSVSTNLQYLYRQQRLAKAQRQLDLAHESGAAPARIAELGGKVAQIQQDMEQYLADGGMVTNDQITRWYTDYQQEAFVWLESDRPEVREMVADIIDTIRALRVADALRQRGTTLKTSAGYPIIVDQKTARAVFALQKGTGEMFLLESSEPISSGEANIASTEVTTGGDLRVSFARGDFVNQEATQRAAYNAALLVEDIQRDILETFHLPPGEYPGLKDSQNIWILLEGTDDNLEFSDCVLAELRRLNPEAGKRSRVVPSLKYIDPEERDRYLHAQDISWSVDRRRRVLARLAESGHQTQQIDIEWAFIDVRLGQIREGETLMLAGAPPAFVYIPMEEGLLSTPLGGYQAFSVRPWIPLGNTRVIRGATQEATVVAQRELPLLIIPKEVYMKYWHATYTVSEFAALLPRFYTHEHLKGFDQILDILRQLALIDSTLDESEVEFIRKFASSYGIDYSAEQLREQLLQGGSTDFVSLHRKVADYLALDPSDAQVAQLRDLVLHFVRADDQVSSEEELIIAELVGMFASRLAEATSLVQYRVLIVPQTPDQDLAITSLFPGFEKKSIAGGSAYSAGQYYSDEYARMICERYRSLGFFTVVDETT